MFWRFHSALEAASSEKVIDDGWRVLRVTCRRSMNRDGCRLSLQPRLSDAESPRLSPLVSSVTTHLHEHCPGEAPGWRGAGTDLRWPPDTVRLYDLVRRNLTLMIDCRHHYFTTVQDDNAHRDSITALTTATQFLGAVFFRCSFFRAKKRPTLVAVVDDGDVHSDSARAERHASSDWKTGSSAGDGGDPLDELRPEVWLYSSA